MSDQKHWKMVKGNIPILVVAAHNLPHLRGQKIKPADINTDTFAKTLANKLHLWTIISTAVQNDPNWYANSPFRKTVKQLILDNKIKLVVDIHGRKAGSNNILEFYPNKPFKHTYPKLFDGIDYPVKLFTDDKQLTISEDLGKMGVPALEIEIRKDARIPGSEQQENAIKVVGAIIASALN